MWEASLVCVSPATSLVLQSAAILVSRPDQVNYLGDTTGEYGLHHVIEQNTTLASIHLKGLIGWLVGFFFLSIVQGQSFVVSFFFVLNIVASLPSPLTNIIVYLLVFDTQYIFIFNHVSFFINKLFVCNVEFVVVMVKFSRGKAGGTDGFFAGLSTKGFWERARGLRVGGIFFFFFFFV